MSKQLLIAIMVMFCQSMVISQDTLAVKTIEGITDKMLELISGPQGEDRDWESFRDLFLPTAQFVSLNPKAPRGRQVRTSNLEQFIRNLGPLYKRDGFEEYSIGLTVNEFNGVASVFQSFYCRNLIGTYEARGINTYQLVFSDNRWWIASLSFSNETEESLIPNQYLFEDHRHK